MCVMMLTCAKFYVERNGGREEHAMCLPLLDGTGKKRVSPVISGKVGSMLAF